MRFCSACAVGLGVEEVLLGRLRGDRAEDHEARRPGSSRRASDPPAGKDDRLDGAGQVHEVERARPLRRVRRRPDRRSGGCGRATARPGRSRRAGPIAAQAVSCSIFEPSAFSARSSRGAPGSSVHEPLTKRRTASADGGRAVARRLKGFTGSSPQPAASAIEATRKSRRSMRQTSLRESGQVKAAAWYSARSRLRKRGPEWPSTTSSSRPGRVRGEGQRAPRSRGDEAGPARPAVRARAPRGDRALALQPAGDGRAPRRRARRRSRRWAPATAAVARLRPARGLRAAARGAGGGALGTLRRRGRPRAR